ncbi:hypothetical protein [Acaryochloris sp. IP29b_bin.137]|uniref:hypothetical protein n=1 Tax=Acaryochloris sp. IP29b_bin.137 TaxID=2969217 RepID=UPI0026083133|nr:hypothetical protein [Acaryochloris sp. IP29b_bin.137]
MSYLKIKCRIAGYMGAIATALALFAAPLSANELTQVLADTPMKLQLKTLNNSWQRLSLNQDTLGPAMLFGISGLFQSALRTNIYYTQGQTITLGKQKYLVVYRPEGSSLTLTELIKSGRNTSPDALIKALTPDTGLVLSLINLAKIDSLQDIQPFDLQQEIRESKQAMPQDSGATEKSNASPQPVDPVRQSK